MDEAVGHYRRYAAPSLKALTPQALTIEKSFYLDCVGMLASGANRLILRKPLPSAGNIKTWDRLMVLL